jgi:hypothetical protein
MENIGFSLDSHHLLLLHSRHELHDEGMSIDVEVAMPLPTALTGNELIGIRTLPTHLDPDGRMCYTWEK